MNQSGITTLTLADDDHELQPGHYAQIGTRLFEIVDVQGRTLTVVEWTPTRWERFRLWMRRVRFRSPIQSPIYRSRW